MTDRTAILLRHAIHRSFHAAAVERYAKKNLPGQLDLFSGKAKASAKTQKKVKWDEEKHPRDDDGKFTDGTGHTGSRAENLQKPTATDQKPVTPQVNEPLTAGLDPELFDPEKSNADLIGHGDEISAYWMPNPEKPGAGRVMVVDTETMARIDPTAMHLFDSKQDGELWAAKQGIEPHAGASGAADTEEAAAEADDGEPTATEDGVAPDSETLTPTAPLTSEEMWTQKWTPIEAVYKRPMGGSTPWTFNQINGEPWPIGFATKVQAVAQALRHKRAVEDRQNEEAKAFESEPPKEDAGTNPEAELAPAPGQLFADPDTPESKETVKDRVSERLVQDFGRHIEARKHTARATGKKAKKPKDPRPTWARRFSIGEIASSSTPDDVGKFSITDEKKKDWFGQPKQVGQLFDSLEEAEKAIPLLAVAQNHTVSNVARTGDPPNYAIRRHLGKKKRPVVKGGFESREAAMKYIAENPVEVIEHKFPSYEQFQYLDNVERNGPEHRTEDVTSESFKDFGIDGGVFGNWMGNKDAQTAANHAYDGLQDLAAVLDIDPAGIGFGDMAMGFGALGTGGKNSARAHYEPKRRVIALTKMEGAGSLAHEWGHALDHLVSRAAHGSDDTDKLASDGLPYKHELRPELATAIKGVVSAMTTKEVTEAVTAVSQSSRMQAKLAKHEAAFQEAKDAGRSYHSPQTAEHHLWNLRNAIQANRDYKANASRGNAGKRFARPVTDAEWKEWDDLAEKVAAGDPGEAMTVDTPNRSQYSLGRQTFGNVEKLNTLYKKLTGHAFHTAKDHSPGQKLYWTIKHDQLDAERLKQASEGKTQVKRQQTDFAREARNLDESRTGDYYTKTHEMFARAFETYVHDRIQDSGQRSDYLIGEGKTDNAYYRAMFDGAPFPEGEEKATIHKAFDTLFDTMRGHELPVRKEKYARQAGLFDESKHPRDEDGRFTATDEMSPQHIEPLNPVLDVDKFDRIKKSYKHDADTGEIEWSGRPLLVQPSGGGWAALTGSHRIHAARALNNPDVRIPVVQIEQDEHELEVDGQPLWEALDQPLDDYERASVLKRYANEHPVLSDAARLMQAELDHNEADEESAASKPFTAKGVEGEQMDLFADDPGKGGQKSLFNVAPASKKKKGRKPASKEDLLAGISGKLRKHLKDKDVISPADLHTQFQEDSLPGQRELFSRARAGDLSALQELGREFYARHKSAKGQSLPVHADEYDTSRITAAKRPKFERGLEWAQDAIDGSQSATDKARQLQGKAAEKQDRTVSLTGDFNYRLLNAWSDHVAEDHVNHDIDHIWDANYDGESPLRIAEMLHETGVAPTDAINDLTAEYEKKLAKTRPDPFWHGVHAFCSRVLEGDEAERYARDQPGQRDLFTGKERRSSKTQGELKWVTIGGHADGEKKHAGGSAVQIDGQGNIVGGNVPKEWHGKHISHSATHNDSAPADPPDAPDWFKGRQDAPAAKQGDPVTAGTRWPRCRTVSTSRDPTPTRRRPGNLGLPTLRRPASPSDSPQSWPGHEGERPEASYPGGKPTPSDDYTDDERAAIDEMIAKMRNPEPEAEPEPAAPEPPAPGKDGFMPVNELIRDPGRFQYKQNVNDEGVTSQFADLDYNPMLGGKLAVWKDPEDGKTYVVNGHHRHELAQRSGYDGDVTVHHIDAQSHEEARAFGALINIADGNGTAVDAAKFLRDTGTTLEDLKSEGVSVTQGLGQDAVTLSKLSPRLFGQLAQGLYRQGRALAIASQLDNHDDQERVSRLIDKREQTGRAVGDATAAEIARQAAIAGRKTETTKDLFGDHTEDRNLFIERAELVSGLRRQMAERLNKFKAVATDKAASTLQSHNQIDAAANRSESQKLAQQMADFERESTLTGPVSSIINKAAEELADAPRTKTAILKQLASDISEHFAAAHAEPQPGAGPDPSESEDSAGSIADREPYKPAPGQRDFFSRNRAAASWRVELTDRIAASLENGVAGRG